MKINGKATFQLFDSDGKEVYRTTNKIFDFENLLTNTVITNNSDNVFDIEHRMRANNAKIVEEAENETD